MKPTEMPEYRQKIRTLGNGVTTPAKKPKKSVNDVTVIETAASLKQSPIRSGTDSWCEESLLQELSNT